MKLTPVLLISFLLTSPIQPALAGNHDAYQASVSTYKPMAGFNHVVGPTRFVGYFSAGPGHMSRDRVQGGGRRRVTPHPARAD